MAGNYIFQFLERFEALEYLNITCDAKLISYPGIYNLFIRDYNLKNVHIKLFGSSNDLIDIRNLIVNLGEGADFLLTLEVDEI